MNDKDLTSNAASAQKLMALRMREYMERTPPEELSAAMCNALTNFLKATGMAVPGEEETSLQRTVEKLRTASLKFPSPPPVDLEGDDEATA